MRDIRKNITYNQWLGGSAYIRTDRLTRRSSGRLTPPLSFVLEQQEKKSE